MSNNKTEALYLADVIENDPTSSAHHYAAVAWMRSQYAEIQRLSDVVSKVNSRCDHLGIRLGEVIAERDALLCALSALGIRPMPNQQGRWLSKHRPGLNFPSAEAAAIDATKGGGNG